MENSFLKSGRGEINTDLRLNTPGYDKRYNIRIDVDGKHPMKLQAISDYKIVVP